MITDETDPLMVAAARALADRLNAIGRLYIQWDRSLFRRLREAVDDHRLRCRQDGLDFPQLAFLIVPRFRRIALVRADIDVAGLRTHLIVLARQLPGVLAEELAAAVKHTFPHLRSIGVDLADEAAILRDQRNAASEAQLR